MRNALSCDALNCVHNANNLCSADRINVDGMNASASSETNCETFVEKGIKGAFTNMMNMNVQGEVKQLFNKNSNSMSPEITCEATSCMHNIDNVCDANGVQIIGRSASSSSGTECETFKK